MSDKPPAEPPPLRESTIYTDTQQHEEHQWIEDAITSAELMLHTIDTHNATNLCKEGYAPIICNLNQNREINDLHLSNKREEYTVQLTRLFKDSLSSLKPHPINIPTPKSGIHNHSALLKNTNDISYNWHISKVDNISESKATMQLNLNSSTSFKICTDTVQNDTGASRNVASIKPSMTAYEDIEPFPI